MLGTVGTGLRLRAWRLARAPRVRGLLERLDERLPQRVETTRYKRFVVVHDRSTSLIQRLRETGEYEPVTTAAVVAELRRSPEPVLLDVGANIGLVSLGVLAALPGARIFAFEPAPHQHELFRQTIRSNGLEAAIELFPLALGETPGSAEFAVHSRRHAAGDGFLDTGRSGASRTVTVRRDALDRWWEAHDHPAIDVIKLDVEGAELLVLRGARSLLRNRRPTLFLEIDPRNVAVYPYEPEDVVAYVEELGYRLDEIEEGEFVARAA